MAAPILDSFEAVDCETLDDRDSEFFVVVRKYEDGLLRASFNSRHAQLGVTVEQLRKTAEKLARMAEWHKAAADAIERQDATLLTTT